MIHAHDPIEVRQIEFKSAEDEKKLVEGIKEEVIKALEDRKDLEKKAKIAVLQYHSALRGSDEDTKTETEDSQIDVPSTRQFTEMAISRFVNPIFQRGEIYVAKPRKPNDVELAKSFESFADWMVDRSKFRIFVEQLLKQAFVFPKGICKVPFRKHTKKIKRYYHEIETSDGNLERHWGLRENDKQLFSEEVVDAYSDERATVEPEVVPWQDFIHPIPTSSIDDAPWVCHRVWASLDNLKRSIGRGVYRSEDLDGNDIIEKLGDPDANPDMKLELSVSGIDSSDKKSQNSTSGGKLFELWEIYTTIDEQEVILTLERKSGVCLRFIENFYMDEVRPFAAWSYENVLNDLDGISLCYILEPGHRALSAILNQRLDAASRSMNMALFYKANMGVEKYLKNGDTPNGAYPVNSVEDMSKNFAQFQINHPTAPMESLEANIKQDQQKLASLTDYNAGVEQIQRPTATGQVALLEEGRQPQYMRMESFRQFLTRVGVMMISRYRQFHPVDMVYYVQSQDPKDQEVTQKMLQWPAEYWQDKIMIEPAVSSQSMNQDLKKQEQLAVMDKFPQMYQTLMQYIDQSLQPTPMAPIALKVAIAYAKKMARFMEVFEIPGADELDFSQEIDIGASFNKAITEAQQQIDGLSGTTEQQSAELQEQVRIIEHLTRQFVAATGKAPAPPPSGKSQVPGPPQAPQGMGGGPPVPGGPGVPPMGQPNG